MCFGEFGDLTNLLLISGSENVDNIKTSKKKVSKNTKENPSGRKLIFEEPAMFENLTKMIARGTRAKRPSKYLKMPYAGIAKAKKSKKKAEVSVPRHEAKGIGDSSKNTIIYLATNKLA
ncbi:hypothetical protein M9H77_01966 [Catharanthus roseus]|uniref:Uncharacterized protein n=1 Tax=Catharanthus roseus TaxID=4058 RepID=A0ACC0C768_CATRO|nr:hypothetical protein M9H77_01966 [Catharanthus roseus]